MIKKELYIGMLILLLQGVMFSLSAQDISINGIVKDAQDEPLMGVVVAAENGQALTLTDVDGHFSLLNRIDRKPLTFSLLGYKTVKAAVKEIMSVVLEPDLHELDAKIELGYTSMSKNDFSGSASTVYSDQLAKAPVPVLMQTFAGNLSGLTAIETNSESARAEYGLYIRGISNTHANQPLVVIDGVVCYPGTSAYSMAYITPAEVESISILKDAASQALYGTQGADGVIVITTKRGVPGKLRVDCTFDASMQQVTTTPTFINSAEYATLRNEAAYNDGLGKNYFFSDADIANYRSSDDPYLYPNTNWHDMLMKKYIHTQRLGVNVSGGNDWVTYFSNVNFMHDGGTYNTESNDKYNPNNNYFWINLRSNVDVKISKSLAAYMNLACNIKKEHIPGGGYPNSIYPHLFSMPSTTYGPVTPGIGQDAYPGDEVIVTENENDSPFAMINRTGYKNNTVTNVYANFGLKWNLDFIAKGLVLSGDIAYMTNQTNTLSTTKKYRRYRRDTTIPDELTFVRKGTTDNSNLSYGKKQSNFYDLYYRGMLNYKFDWRQHHLDATAYSFYQHYESEKTVAADLLPYDHITAGFDLAYNYDHRYALRFDAGYSGSEAYARSSRWTATPAVSAAWILSNEAFMKKQSVVSLAKLRLSYGLTGNDQTGIPRYSYEDNVTLQNGGQIQILQYFISENSIGNPQLQAETMKKFNWGIDLGLFNMVNLSVDVYREKMDNMICQSIALIPSYQGVPLKNYPMTNSGSFENRGYEVELSVGKSFKDFEFSVGGSLAYNKNEIKDVGEVSLGEDYAYPYRQEGFSVGQTFGYKVDYSNGNGFFNFASEIDHAPKYAIGTPRLGDLKYRDLNEDGIIDEKDKAPITYGKIPNYFYSFNGYFKYKSFDLSILFQGVGRWNSCYTGMGVWENEYDGSFGALHRHAWTEERWNNGETITSPALSTTTTVNHQESDYYVYNRSYLRLKNLELGYTLPAKVTRHLGVRKLRFALSGQNLFTWDHMKSDDFGPEGSYKKIPVYRVYNIGVRATF